MLISERTSLRNIRNGDGEPWIADDSSSIIISRGTLDSISLRCSFLGQKSPSLMGRCVLLFFMLAVFIFGVILAFLMGHWVTKPRKTAELSNTMTTQTSKIDPAVSTYFETVLDNAKKTISKNTSMFDVYPPTSNGVSSTAFHISPRNRAIRKHRKVPLSTLPKTPRPVHYELQLDFTEVATKEQISGNISIVLESVDISVIPNEVIFHASSNVNINWVRLHQQGKNIGILRFRREQRLRIVHLSLERPLKYGRYALEMQFVTKICQDNMGGVQCYRGTENEEVKLSSTNQHPPIISFTTKFEPSLARTFFPCWDEPSWKTTFNISILHLNSVTVLTNTAPIHFIQKQRHSFAQTKFQETPPITTFLLAFVFGPYNSIERRTEHGVTLKVWTFPEDLVYAKFAANFSPYMFDRLAEEFVMPYPLPKIDLVAARIFPVGGMENWGLIIIQNEMFLLDSVLESNANMTVDLLAEQYAIEKIITHELAHQWFGNLVTINDWSELWLSEGFASFYANEFLNKQHPLLATNEYFLHLSQLLLRQTSNEKLALVELCRTEMEVEGAFNPYHLYTKGAVIVKMMRDLVGENNFRKGIRKFLKTNAYKSVGRSALWKAITAYTNHGVENEKLEDVIEPWLLNSGMPEVIVSRSYNDGSIRLTQRTSNQNRYLIFLQTTDTENHSMTNFKNPKRKQGGQKEMELLYSLQNAFTDRSKVTNFSNVKKSFASPRDEFVSGCHWKLRKLACSKRRHIKYKKTVADGHFKGKKLKTRGHTEPQQNWPPTYNKQLWSIPFDYRPSFKTTIDDSIRKFWFHNETITFTDNNLRATTPLLANINWKFPYRVNYDIENWKMLARMLHENHLSIPSHSRMQLMVDSEFYLKQSGVPEIYLYILSYLIKENDIGLLLFGLDALYRFFDMFRGSSISDLLLIFLREITEWVDQVMEETKTKPEQAALWLLDANRLFQFYKLRCAVNLSTCDVEDKVEQWIKSGGLAEDDPYSQMTAICHHLLTKGTKPAYDLVENGLKQFSSKWTTTIQLATCIRNEDILRRAVSQIVATRNAAIYTAVLKNEFTLLYNEKFRTIFWSEIAEMPLLERKLLFSIEADQANQVAQILAHSVRSSNELEHLINIVPDWGYHMKSHIDYLRRKYQWINEIASPRIEHFLKVTKRW